jgi:predicted ferric reductase
MVPMRRGLKFEPGQFVFVSFRAKGISPEWHPFTISSSTADPTLGVTVKSLGKYTEKLAKLADSVTGVRVKVEGAYGRFEFKNVGGSNQIWVGGGIGITPFLSMARSMATNEAVYNVDLYYSVRTESELVDLDLLQQALVTNARARLRVIPFVTEKQGYLTAKFVNETSAGLAGKEILICGPPPMMAGMRKQFRALGVKNGHIHTEEFRMS